MQKGVLILAREYVLSIFPRMTQKVESCKIRNAFGQEKNGVKIILLNLWQ